MWRKLLECYLEFLSAFYSLSLNGLAPIFVRFCETVCDLPSHNLSLKNSLSDRPTPLSIC